MASTPTPKGPSAGRKGASRKGSAGLIFTVVYLAAMVLLYIGERLVLESTAIRATLGGLAVVGIVVAILGRVLRRKKLPAPARAVESRILLCYALGALGLLLYLAQADFMMDKLRPLFEEARGADRYQGALTALWPAVWICAIVPLIFIEISYVPMDVVRTLDVSRVRRSSRSGALLALTLCLIFVLNFILAEYNKKVDLSYFKTTRPSESSKKMVANLSEPLKAVLFFPDANEVAEEAQSYFEELKEASKQLQVQLTDQVMEPELAKELQITANGTVALVRNGRNKKHEQISLGTKLQTAKRKLKRLDTEFQTAFRKVMQQQKVIYLTVGHEERTKELRGGERGSSIRQLHSLVLEPLNYTVKDLGIAQGLGSEVPADASVVIVAGPRKEFLPAETDALKRYLERGGRMMVFLDPEAGVTLEPLLGSFGLKFTPTKLVNDRFNIRLTRTEADQYIMLSNRFSAHPSVTTLTQNANRVATVVLGAGYLEEIPPEQGHKSQVQFTIHSMPFTFNDVNNNRVFDTGSEQRKVYELAAVVTMKVDAKNKDKDKHKHRPGDKDKHKKDEASEARMIVVADSDVIADQVFRNAGNGYLFVDGVKWLAGEEEIIGETSSEEDVRIMHTRKEDKLWFYLTVLGVPLLVLGVGLYYSYAIRRRRKR